MPPTPLQEQTIETVPPRWRQRAFRLRYLLLALYLITLAGLTTWLIIENNDWLFVSIALLIFLGAQAFFLIGMPQLRWPNPTHGAPMIVSMITGALIAGLLTFGLLATLLNIGPAWERLTDAVELNILWVIAAAWAAWFFVFFIMWAGEWLMVFKKIYKLLIAGTVLELLVTIPVDVHVRRRTSCWCGEGTFFALIIGGTVALWSFGPGIVMLLLTRRLQRKGYFSICRKCAYDLRGLDPTTKRCPECGTRVPEKYRTDLSNPN